MKPNHPTLAALIRLHAELGGKIFENRKEAKRLAGDMLHIEAVIRMFSPGFDFKAIAARRRYKGNGLYKRGTLLGGIDINVSSEVEFSELLDQVRKAYYLDVKRKKDFAPRIKFT